MHIVGILVCLDLHTQFVAGAKAPRVLFNAERGFHGGLSNAWEHGQKRLCAIHRAKNNPIVAGGEIAPDMLAFVTSAGRDRKVGVSVASGVCCQAQGGTFNNAIPDFCIRSQAVKRTARTMTYRTVCARERVIRRSVKFLGHLGLSVCCAAGFVAHE